MKMQQTKQAIKKLKTLVAAPYSDVDKFRKDIEQTFSSPLLPNRVEMEKTTINGIECDVLIPEVCSTSQLILYVHGGSFIGGSPASWRGFCASLAHASCAKLILPKYRLAPQQPFPAGLDDIKAVMKKLYTEPKDIILVADGSGASIALGVLLKIKASFRKKIKAVVLFSPWINVSEDLEHSTEKKPGKDKILTPEALKWSAELYTYSENLKSPYISPVYADLSMLENFPSLYIQVAKGELIEPDINYFQGRLRKFGISCEVDTWQNVMHMFQRADEFLEESHLAVEKAGKYIREKEDL